MRRALGKGLSQLFGEQEEAGIREIELANIVPNERQPRTQFEDESLQELAESIREHGILQPLLVRAVGEDRYELIAGERRWRAAQLAGLESVPVTVRSASDQHSLELALIENVQREDISPLDAARAYQQLSAEFDLTQDQIAKRVGKSRVSIANTLRILRLPKKVLEGLESGKISEGHARALLQIENEIVLLAIYDKILERGLSVRQVEEFARATNSKPAKKQMKKAAASIPAEWSQLQDGMSVYFGSPVSFQASGSGGKIVIDFYSDEDLTRILDVLGIHL